MDESRLRFSTTTTTRVTKLAEVSAVLNELLSPLSLVIDDDDDEDDID